MRNSHARRRGAAGAVALFTALSLAGCSAAGSPSATPSDDRANDPDASITVGVRFLQPSWDPAKMPGATIVPIYQLVYDSLVGLDAEMNLVPSLAESWETTDGGTTWDFELRDDVVFSDGSTFDAADVKATLEHYAGEGSNTRADLATVTAVEVVDEHTVRIVQDAANVGIPETMAGRAGLVLSSEAVASGDFSTAVGTGKFLIESDVQGVELGLVRNDEYWNPDAVQLAGVTLRWIEDPVAMANAIRSNEIDMAQVEPAQADAVESGGVPGYDILGAQFVGFSLNPDIVPELADPLVREALSMAIDREGIVAGIMFGRAEVANQFVAPGRFGFNEDVADIPYDIDAAKKLLAEAGYPNGFSAQVIAQANNKQLAEAVQSSWAEIGVDVELSFPPGSGVADASWAQPTVGIASQNLVPEVDPTPFLWRHLSTETIRNPGKIELPEVTALMIKARAAVDVEEREKIFHEIAELTRETTTAYIPVLWRNFTIAYSDKLTGVQESQAGYPILDGVGVAAQ